MWLPQCRIYVFTNGSILRVIPQGCVFIYPQMSKLSCFVYTLQIWRIQRCKCLFVRLWLSLMSSRHCSPYLIVFKHLTRNLASERTGKESKMKRSEHKLIKTKNWKFQNLWQYSIQMWYLDYFLFVGQLVICMSAWWL